MKPIWLCMYTSRVLTVFQIVCWIDFYLLCAARHKWIWKIVLNILQKDFVYVRFLFVFLSYSHSATLHVGIKEKQQQQQRTCESRGKQIAFIRINRNMKQNTSTTCWIKLFGFDGVVFVLSFSLTRICLRIWNSHTPHDNYICTFSRMESIEWQEEVWDV